MNRIANLPGANKTVTDRQRTGALLESARKGGKLRLGQRKQTRRKLGSVAPRAFTDLGGSRAAPTNFAAPGGRRGQAKMWNLPLL